MALETVMLARRSHEAVKQNTQPVATMERLENRQMFVVGTDGLDLGGLLGNLGLGDLGGFSGVPNFPAQEEPLYLGRFADRKTRTIEDSVGPSDGVDSYRIKVSKRMRFTFDLRGLSQDADLVIYDGSGNVVGSSGNFGSLDEHISLKLGKGSYYACVFSAGTDAKYTLKVASRLVKPAPAPAAPVAMTS